MRRPRPRRHRIDAKQARIVEVLRRCGALVLPLSDLGGNVADLLVCYRGRLFLQEVKADGQMPTTEQAAWLAAWGGHVVRSERQALKIIGAI